MKLDRVIHSPARLAIVRELMVVDEADATWLHGRTGLSWGNLATHARKLEDAGYVEVEKEFEGRKPRTILRMTKAGEEAYRDYRKAMLDLLQ